MNYGQRFVTLYRDRDQDHPHGKEMQKNKMAVWGGLISSREKKRSKNQRRKGKIFPFECFSKEKQGAIRNPSSVISAKKQENDRMGKTRDLFKLEIPREHFIQRWAQ